VVDEAFSRETWAPRALAALRIITGYLFVQHGTAKLLGVSTPSVMAWIEQFAEVFAQKPEPEGRAVVVELDEMWHFLKKNGTSSGSGRLGIVLQAEWLTGNAGVVTPAP